MKNKRLLKLLGAIGLVLVIAALLMTGCAKPTPAPATTPAPAPVEVKWRLGTGRPDVSDEAIEIKKMAERIESRTGGNFKITCFVGSQLGDWQEKFALHMVGQLELSLNPINPAFDPRFAFYQLPYLFATTEEAVNACAPDGWATKTMTEIFGDYGVKCLGLSSNGPMAFTNSKHSIRTPDDLKDIKVRIQDAPPIIEFFRACGATVTVMPFSEVYTALQTAVIDGQDNGAYTVYQRLRDVQSYYTTLYHWHDFIALSVTEDAFDALPAEYQEILLEESEKSLATMLGGVMGREEVYLKKLEDEAGYEITRLTDEERQPWIDIGRSLWLQFEDDLGAPLLNAAMEQAGLK